MSQITIKDIARMANVSITAVSLALNNKPGISTETKEKILRIAQEYGYVHKSLRSDPVPVQDKSKVIHFVACTNQGIIIEHFEQLPFFTKLINHISDYLFSKGYSMMITPINLDNLYEEMKQFSEKNGRGGVLLLGTDLTQQQISFIARHQPNIVVLDTCFETLNVDFVNMNSVLGAYQAAKYLISLGHRRIGYVESNVRIRNFELRKEGFLAALREHGIQMLEHDYFSVIPTIFTSSQENLKREILKRKHDMPTALFCESDYIAISVIKSLIELDIKVPDDISVIGFDNIHEASIITPELTTVHVYADRMASLAVDRIIELMEDRSYGYKMKYIVDTDIYERNSCRPPAKSK